MLPLPRNSALGATLLPIFFSECVFSRFDSARLVTYRAKDCRPVFVIQLALLAESCFSDARYSVSFESVPAAGPSPPRAPPTLLCSLLGMANDVAPSAAVVAEDASSLFVAPLMLTFTPLKRCSSLNAQSSSGGTLESNSSYLVFLMKFGKSNFFFLKNLIFLTITFLAAVTSSSIIIVRL